MKSIYSTGQQLYEAIQDESTKLYFIFCSAHGVLFFPYSTRNTAVYTVQ